MRFSAPILAGLALAACSNPSTEGEVTGQRLVLRACAGGQDVPSDPVVTRHWDFKAIRAGWTARNGRASLQPKRVVFEFEDQGSIELDEVPAGGFDRIDIYMRAPREGQLRLELKNTDGRTIHRGSIFFGRSDPDQLKKLQFPLQKVRHRLHNIGRVILHFPKDLAQVTLTGITFLSTTPESWLPDPLAPDMMAFGSDRRMSVGLSSRRPLQASFEAQAGTYFSFGCGAPVGLRDGSQPGLTLEFLDGAGKMVAGHEFTVPVGSWCTEQVVIDESLARVGSLTARFSLGPGQDGTVTACALTAPRVDSWLKDPPTVLLLTSDTHRADHLGFMQATEVDTPTLDRLASEGIAFTDCWAAANVTNPAHISIMTGTGVQDHGIVSNDIPVSPQFLTLAEAFSNQGYRTYAALSVAHLAWGGMEQGFERLSSPDRSQRDSSETIAILEQWLEEDVTQGRPLFVWLHLFDAHAAYKPPPPYDQMYQPGDGEDPFDPANKGRWGEVEMPSWCSQVTDPRYVQALYRGEVTYQDHALGELLKRQPRLGRDLLVFVGDHGENLSDQRPNFDHTDLTTVTQHIPLILAGARVPRHGLVQRPVTQVDVGRTLLDLAGLEGTEFPGDNLLLGLDDPPPDEPVTRFAIQAHALKASAKRGKWYLTHGLYAPERAQGVRIRDHEMLLYDLQADPDCLIDVLDEQRDIALELRADLLRWLMDSRVAEFLSNDHRTDQATLRALASLGYSAGSALPDDNPWIDPACECEWCTGYPVAGPSAETGAGD